MAEIKELILGGARSGKSRLAEQRASDSALPVRYIATAQAGDDEMAARIAHHQTSRPPEWALVEEPIELASVLAGQMGKAQCVLVDCLTLWLSNLLANGDEQLNEQIDALLALMPQLDYRLILVSNEVGSGVVPMGELSRRFVDAAGRLHQQLAVECDHVTLVCAGLPIQLK
jgi:adenosylcobinamide kinase/adenosylcobinamide-phosphate guanylyltransferase